VRGSSWHHRLGVARAQHVASHHLSFEMRGGLNEYMRGTGRLLRAGVERLWGPGRHKAAADNTFSDFLHRAGNTVEYTTELEMVDQWGAADAMNEMIATTSFDDPDTGTFSAPLIEHQCTHPPRAPLPAR
jgi:hypothetical protein